MIDKHFPTWHKLHKIFSRNNLKVSYSCSTNMANINKNHNQKILNECNDVDVTRKMRNCLNKELCRLVVNVSQIILSTRPLLQHIIQIHEHLQRHNKKTISKHATTTNSVSMTQNTLMPRYFLSTCGN